MKLLVPQPLVSAALQVGTPSRRMPSIGSSTSFRRPSKCRGTKATYASGRRTCGFRRPSKCRGTKACCAPAPTCSSFRRPSKCRSTKETTRWKWIARRFRCPSKCRGTKALDNILLIPLKILVRKAETSNTRTLQPRPLETILRQTQAYTFQLPVPRRRRDHRVIAVNHE